MYGGVVLGGLTAFVVAGVWLSEDPDSPAAGALAVGAFLGTPVLALVVWLATRPSEEERSRVADRPNELLSASELRLRLTSDWRPESKQQWAAAAGFAKRRRGALVRQRPDGVTELLTGSKGTFTRYAIDVDGSMTEIETIPSDGSYRLAGRTALAGVALFVAAIVFAGGRDPGWDGREVVGAVVAFVGFVAVFVGVAARGGEDGEHGALRHTQPGERWKSVGYPSD